MIIYLSSVDYKKMKELCLENEKADGFVKKPFTKLRLEKMLKMLRIIPKDLKT